MIMIYLLFIYLLSISFGDKIKLPFNDNSSIIYQGSHPAHKWQGVSTDVRGGVICEDNQCIIQVIVPLESFDSGSSGRDSNMLFSTESHKYPYIKYYSDSFIIDSMNEKSINLSGYIEFHGVKKYIQNHVIISNQDSVLLGFSDFSISLDDYKIERPQLLFVPISDQIKLKCNLFCNNIFSKL